MPTWLIPLLASVAPAAISAITQIFETKKAADTQSSAAADATSAELGMFATGQAALQPYISGGAKDLGLLTGTPGHPAVPAHWATASGKDVVRGANWHPTPAVQATWKNPQGQTVQMAPAWKPGAAQKGWVLQSPGAAAGHATPSKWVGPGGAIVNKPWNWKPPAGQAQHWTLKTPGQQPTVGWTQKSKGSAATAGTAGALQDTFMKPIVMDQAALEQTPGYQFQLAQGLKSGVNALTARGLGPTSGAAVKGAETYAEGLASENYQQQFSNALANKNMEWTALYGAGQLGESAGAHVAQQAATTGANVASNIVGSGAVQAGADIATANAVTGITNTLSLQQLAANQRALAQISPPATPAPTG